MGESELDGEVRYQKADNGRKNWKNTPRPTSPGALRVTNRFLEIANAYSTIHPLLNAFVQEIKELTKCSGIGIRLLDCDGNIPYEAYSGFPDEFYNQENQLSIKKDSCLCVDIMREVKKPRLQSFYTEKGSFYIGGITSFKSQHEQDAEIKSPSGGRGACPAFGYETLCLIPIKLREKIIGLIHLADHRKDAISPSRLAMLEQAAMQLGGAIVRVQNDNELQLYRHNLEIMVRDRTAELRHVNEMLERKFEESERLSSSLRLSRQRYDLLFQASNFAIFVHHPTQDGRPGCFFEVNDTACQLLGYSREELLSLTPNDIVDLGKVKITPSEAISLLKVKKELLVESILKKKDGSNVPVEVNIHQSSLEGSPIVLSTVRDISVRKRLESEVKSSQEALDLMLAQMPCILWTMDKDLRYTSAQGLGLKLSGREPRDLVGKTIFEYSPRFNENSPLIIAYRKSLTGIPQMVEQQSTLNERVFLIYMQPMYGSLNSICGIVGVSVDITERKRTELDLLDKEERLSELAKAYVHAQEEQRQWLSLEIHDRVIQPMSAVYQQLQALTPQINSVPGIADGLNRAVEISEDVINETRAVMKELYPATLSRYGLIKILREELNKLQDQTGIRTDFKYPEGFECPESLDTTLYRIFHEAILNITNHSGATRVSVTLVQQDHQIRLSVTDDGIGFDAGSIDKTIGGLVCMRRRTEIMGGKFDVNSKSGGGTSICSTLPIPKVADQE
ncbi:PAS domain S-box-containing protein [Dehalogenimonas formicexedens]|uniref:PAS domain S-box-containing protein n=1 Tax=Dehalogenimonas formicexedens TaxID=1839801 RepID=A0A1P8F5G4_9CHLR|nr:PAS domain S-box protein [Dehalogenimonas formicexedens]APV43727.1 PAS domain S-box-containing protein [Dehalogenimonas formicexedens]